MAKMRMIELVIEKPKKKRKGVHSKNASKGQKRYKKKKRGQGKKR
jgi:hypothetical protein